MTDYEPTPEQAAVLAHEVSEHARLLAGPGTGKSATVVALITRLLGNEPAPRIRLLTFTRAATAELAHKVEEHPQVVVDRPSTIHSFAISALLSNPGSADFPDPLRIADDWELRNLIERGLAAMVGVTPTVVRRKLIPEMAANWELLEPDPHPEIDEQTRNRFLGAWDQHRRIYGYTLLAELPDLLRRALENHRDLRGVDFEMLVVDEYQDLNACDLRVLQLLAEKGTSVVAVGDDEQSIYSFRKAHPEGIRRFPTYYEGCADYTLSVSHRCGSEIIAWARHVIEGDPSRPADRARLRPSDRAAAGEVALLGFASNSAEAKGVARIIVALIENEGLEPSEILVLCRGDYNAAFSGPIKKALEDQGIPVDDPSAVQTMLNEPANRAIILLLRLLADRNDSLAWAGLIELESGVGDSFTSSIYELARDRRGRFSDALLEAFDGAFADAKGARNKAAALVDRTLQWLDRNSAPEALEEKDWGEWIIEVLLADPPSPLSDELGEVLLGVDELVEPGMPLGRYLGLVQPLARDRAQSRAAGVRFMSMVSSKGLTVEAAIVFGGEEGLIPRPDADVEEERRLLYVAMTRARRFQFVTWAARRTGPTARAGAPRVMGRRNESRFLRNGPVASQDGPGFVQGRFGS
jgi:DNA helicase-2/ATP-dependent DNA helicase PcrA